MTLDIKNIIEGLEAINKRLGFEYKAICSAIKVMKIYRSIRGTTRNHDMGQVTKVEIDCILNELEEKFFPSIITQGFKVKIEGKSMEEIHRTANFIRNHVESVKEVVMHDRD